MALTLIVLPLFLVLGTPLMRKLARTVKFRRLHPMQTKATDFVTCLRSLYRFKVTLKSDI
jgi:cytochrome c oxidase assembly factor CtaG